MKITTRETYINNENIIQKIDIVITAVGENDIKTLKRIYDKQREFEIEFEALMSKYGLRLELPF